ncbi:MAG TPA: glutaredoxin family protein [Vicinamibacterales bacterium]|jgi:hypothetical protein
MWKIRRGQAAPLSLTLYSRPGCHLCDLMRETIRQVSTRIPLTLEDVDISTDHELVDLYGVDIPVLMAGEREIARHGVTAAALEAKLRRMA